MLSFLKKSISFRDKKSKSIDELEKIGFVMNSDFPLVNFDQNIKLKSLNAVSNRVYILYLLNLVALNEVDAADAKQYFIRYSVFFHLTPKEIEFLENPTIELKSEYTWKIECVWILLWALKKVDDITLPNEFCCSVKIRRFFFAENHLISPIKFLNNCKNIRTKEEIFDKVDLYLKINWNCIDANLNGKTLNDVNQKIVYERLYALQWIMNYNGMKWDEMPCDNLTSNPVFINSKTSPNSLNLINTRT